MSRSRCQTDERSFEMQGGRHIVWAIGAVYLRVIVARHATCAPPAQSHSYKYCHGCSNAWNVNVINYAMADKATYHAPNDQ